MSDYTDDHSRDIKTTVRQEDGKITMESSSVMRLRVDSPRLQPLGANERHATVSLSTVGVDVEFELDAAALDALLDDLRAIQSGDAFDETPE